MKFIALLTAAHVGGVLRHPHEGVLHLEDGEAQRLLDNGSGKDVTGDFTAAQQKDVPVESITTVTSDAPVIATDRHQHQSEIAPHPAAETKAPAPKGGKVEKE